MTRSKKYVGITIQVYAIAMFLLSLRNYAASSIRPTGMAEEIVLLSRPILYAIITVTALILIVIAWWKKENSTDTFLFDKETGITRLRANSKNYI